MIDAVIAELGQLLVPAWWATNWVPLLNIIMIDLVLAGDNAIIVGLAAAQVDPKIRGKVIFWGIVGAVVLRIIFALLTSQLLAIVGLKLAGGFLLLFVCWKMYQQLREGHAEQQAAGASAASASGDSSVAAAAGTMGFGAALLQIILADVTMSLDNILAVAGAAKGSPLVLTIGLAIAIVMMAVASHAIANLLVRYPWISWVGLVIILYVALEMIYKGGWEVAANPDVKGVVAPYLGGGGAPAR